MACMLLYTFITISTQLSATEFTSTYQHRSVRLTPDQDNQQGASITIINSTNIVSINEFKNQWQIISDSNEWIMKLHLTQSWGFNKHFGSTVTITFDSPTIGGPQTFDSLMIGISVPHSNKYIALDLNWNDNNKIIPFCDTSKYPTTSMKEGDVSEFYDSIHRDNINDYSENMQPSSIDHNTFPITINLINYPKFSQPHGHYLYVQYTSAGFSSGFIQQCGFEPFDTEKGLDIYFGVGIQWDEETLIAINSFGVEYTDEQSAFRPTTTAIYGTTSDYNTKYSTVVKNNMQSTDAMVNESMNLWSKHQGIWIVCILALLTCICGFILLYFSTYEKQRAKDIKQYGKVDNDQILMIRGRNSSHGVSGSSLSRQKREKTKSSVTVTPFSEQSKSVEKSNLLKIDDDMDSNNEDDEKHEIDTTL